MNWQELSTSSHYKTAVAIGATLGDGNFEEAKNGIDELIEALSRSEKRALKSQLVRLMVHVLKWKTQPEKRSRSWIATIYSAREEIADIQEETPSLTNAIIEGMWEKCLRIAKREAEAEMNQKSVLSELSWQDVFDEGYGM